MPDLTPIDTTPNTLLDALKAAYLRTHDRIGTATDSLIGSLNVDEDSDAVGNLDEADYNLAVLVCEQLGYDEPDRMWTPSREHHPDLFTYDNGEPIYYPVNLPGVTMYVWPRFDSRQTLSELFGYSIDLAYRQPVAPEHDEAKAGQ